MPGIQQNFRLVNSIKVNIFMLGNSGKRFNLQQIENWQTITIPFKVDAYSISTGAPIASFKYRSSKSKVRARGTRSYFNILAKFIILGP
jgi:hypothetical protein